MSLIDDASHSFHQNIDTTRDALALMLDPMLHACTVITQCFVNGNKLVCCGAGGASLTAEYLTAIMTGGLQIPRPALPAICLSDCQRNISMLSAGGDERLAFVDQLNALGHQGDVLFVISNRKGLASLAAVIDAARDRDMVVVALCAREDEALQSSLRDTDIDIPCAGENHMRTHELQILAVHTLCDLVDKKLMGPV